MTTTEDAMTDTATLTIRGSWYRDGSTWIVVLTGMPEQPVRVGTGDTVPEAWASLEATAVQSVGSDSGERAALEWAAGSGWIDDADAIEAASAIKAPMGDVTWSDDDYAYVACCYGVDGDEPGDCSVRVGKDEVGLWWIDSGDDYYRDALSGPYNTEDDARGAAEDLATSQHEGEDDEDADAMAARLLDEASGAPAPDGCWCVWWETAGDDSHAEERYATEAAAIAAAARAQVGLESGHPGAHLLCHYETRQLVGGQWVRSEGGPECAA